VRTGLALASAMVVVLAIPTQALADDFQRSPVEYRKTTLQDEYFKWMPNGIYIGRQGSNRDNLLIASVVTNELRLVDPDSGRILKRWGPEQGMRGVDDMVEGPDGTIYHVNADGTGLGVIRPNGDISVIAEDVTQDRWTNAVAISKDGETLFFTQAIGADAIFTLDLTDPRATAVKHGENLGWHNSSDFGKDGMVYGGNNLYGGIMRFDPKTGKDEIVFTEGMEFVSSAEINDATGMIYATEFYLGHVSKIDLAKGTRRIIATLPSFLDNVAVEDKPNPRIFAVSYAYDAVYETFENGDPPRLISQGDGSIPEGIAVIRSDSGERLFIRDRFRLMEYNPATGRYKSLAQSNFEMFTEDRPGIYDLDRVTWHDSVKDQASLHWTRSLHAVGDDKLITAGSIADHLPGRVVIFDLKTNLPIRVEKGFKPTTSDAIVVGDDIYVANGNSVTRVTPDGTKGDVFTGKSPIAFAQSDTGAWMTDYEDGKLYQVAAEDRWLDTPREILSGLNGPQGIAVANDGSLLLVEEKFGEQGQGRLLKVDPSTGNATVIYDNLNITFSSQLMKPIAQVAQTSDGTIYLSEPGALSFSLLQPRN